MGHTTRLYGRSPLCADQHMCVQNVDRLHHKAGSKNIVELHGTTHRQALLFLCLAGILITSAPCFVAVAVLPSDSGFVFAINFPNEITSLRHASYMGL